MSGEVRIISSQFRMTPNALTLKTAFPKAHDDESWDPYSSEENAQEYRYFTTSFPNRPSPYCQNDLKILNQEESNLKICCTHLPLSTCRY
jgi:hypothetical protein